MKVGYIRVSTEQQNTARQDSMLNDMVDKIFTEKISGKNTNRPKLIEMLNFIRENDILYIESLSRLGRSTKDLIQIVEQLDNKGVQLISLKEKIDTTTPQGKLMFHIFASLAEFERDTMKQRQKEGIEEAKKAGKYKGRIPIYVDDKIFEKLYTSWKSGELKAVQVMKDLNLKPNTFYRRVKEYEKRFSQC